jgi:hypothetical protein
MGVSPFKYALTWELGIKSQPYGDILLKCLWVKINLYGGDVFFGNVIAKVPLKSLIVNDTA